MKLQAGKTYVCRNGKIKTITVDNQTGYLFCRDDIQRTYYYGNNESENDSYIWPADKTHDPHDIVCEFMP